jgi:cysteine desulfurase
MIEPDDIIYLDNNATTRIDPAVLEEMLPFLEKYYGNPSSGYRFGAQVRNAIDLARERIARLLGCAPGEIVFTSCGTEASNTAIHSALQLDAKRQHVVTTAVEHSATMRSCEEVVRRGGGATFVGVDSDGNLDLEGLEAAVRPETAIISTMWANNETGVLFDVDQILEITRRKRVLLHFDAVQAVGKLPVRANDLPLNFLSVSAHKLHGPKGVGALYVNRRTAFRPFLMGGGQEDNRRSGTENVASIIGFGKAAELALQHIDEQQTRVRALRDEFEASLQSQIPDTFINGAAAPRLPNTTSISFNGVDASAALILLDQERICCSAGSACRSGAHDPSHVLRAMGLSEEHMRGSVRFSFGRFNTETEMDRAVRMVARAVARLRAMAPAA